MDPVALEREQQRRYREVYRPAQLEAQHPPGHYFGNLVRLRVDLLRAAYRGGVVLDLCCGSGAYDAEIAAFAEHVVGVDFSHEMVAAAAARAREQARPNLAYCVANARGLPLAAGSVALLFSFSSLYYIPRVEDVVTECARVLRPGGVALLEFGGLWSLNTLVCRAHPDLAIPCHVPLSRLRAMLRGAGLVVERHRAFQLLPLWGDRPRWLGPLLHPAWKRLLARRVRGRMLDEIVSSAWPLRTFAFRHLMLCRKPGA